MKKFILLLLILLLVCCMVSCNENPITSNTDNTLGSNTNIDKENDTGSNSNDSVDNNSSTNNVQPPLSAYEQLNDIEKEIFDTFVNAATSLHNPSSARMYEIYSFKTLYTTYEQFMQEKDLALCIKISAQNALGSTTTRTIMLALRSTAQEYSVIADYTDYFDNPDKPPYISYNDLVSFNLASPSKINKALKEYWEDLGF